MRSDKVDGAEKNHGAVGSARVEIHPSANTAAQGLMTAMAVEFDRWMADEVEELAETVSVVAGSAESEHMRGHLHQLAEQLVRQAELLGYPDVMRIAERLKRQFDPTVAGSLVDLSEIDLRIVELREILRR
ncbi:hypothetical protein [Microbaculum sp. FT89]|uniref:hypothetical protein n=1 Tax=Microbaculum sp. FT89 TaxID=3447298 RepID=UPI003F539C66